MALSTKKDYIIYLLGALQKLISQVELPQLHWNFICNLLDVIHKFIEKHGE